MTLSHFSAAVICAAMASVVFGITLRSTPREMVRYGLKCFAMFVGGVVLGGWVMWILKH